jgi:hypothetical protein
MSRRKNAAPARKRRRMAKAKAPARRTTRGTQSRAGSFEATAEAQAAASRSKARSYDAAKNWVRRSGTQKMKALLEGSGAAAADFRETLKALTRAGSREASHARAMREGWYNPGKPNPEALRYKRGVYEVIIDDHGSFSPALYAVKIFDTSRGRRVAYDGDWEHRSASKAKTWADSWVKQHQRKGTKRQRTKWAAKGLRPNLPAKAERGFSRKYLSEMRRRKSTQGADAPTVLSAMGKLAGGTRYWDVTSAYNTPWRYELRHLDDGFVVAFKSRRRGSKSKYITPGGSATTSRTDHSVYYRTQKEAFRSMVDHISVGKHLAFKYNRHPGMKAEDVVWSSRGKRRAGVTAEDVMHSFRGKKRKNAGKRMTSAQRAHREDSVLAMQIKNERGISLGEAWDIVRSRGGY